MLATDTNNPKFSEFSDTEKFDISLPLLLNLVVAEVSVDMVSGGRDLAHAHFSRHWHSLLIITTKCRPSFVFFTSNFVCDYGIIMPSKDSYRGGGIWEIPP